jgi:hypothetical protein
MDMTVVWQFSRGLRLLNSTALSQSDREMDWWNRLVDADRLRLIIFRFGGRVTLRKTVAVERISR